MNINAQKVFEFVLMLIIFYGVYSLFDSVAQYLFAAPETVWVVLISLVVAAGMLVLYSYIIKDSAKKQSAVKIKELEEKLHQKDSELQSAFKIKKDTEVAAEQTIHNNEE